MIEDELLACFFALFGQSICYYLHVLAGFIHSHLDLIQESVEERMIDLCGWPGHLPSIDVFQEILFLHFEEHPLLNILFFEH